MSHRTCGKYSRIFLGVSLAAIVKQVEWTTSSQAWQTLWSPTPGRMSRRATINLATRSTGSPTNRKFETRSRSSSSSRAPPLSLDASDFIFSTAWRCALRTTPRRNSFKVFNAWRRTRREPSVWKWWRHQTALLWRHWWVIPEFLDKFDKYFFDPKPEIPEWPTGQTTTNAKSRIMMTS